MYIAIDIGGTKTLIAAFSKNGLKLKSKKFPTPKTESAFLKDLETNLQSFSRYHPTAVVCAIPGLVQKNETVIFGNRPWRGNALTFSIKNLFSCPVFFENDANLATIYEASRLRQTAIYLTFSTGIGGGISQNGQLLITPSATFEPGHQTYLFNNQIQEWEDIASAHAIVKAYHITSVTSLRDKTALQDIANRLTPGLTDIIRTYRPNTIIIGGPLAFIFPKFRPYLLKNLRTALNTPPPRLIKARRPTESVIYGCYLYAKTSPSPKKPL